MKKPLNNYNDFHSTHRFLLIFSKILSRAKSAQLSNPFHFSGRKSLESYYFILIFRMGFKYRGTPFNLSVYRTDQGTELYSVQIRTLKNRVYKFNIGERSELSSDPSCPIMDKIMNATFIEVDAAKKPDGKLRIFHLILFNLFVFKVTVIPEGFSPSSTVESGKNQPNENHPY